MVQNYYIMLSKTIPFEIDELFVQDIDNLEDYKLCISQNSVVKKAVIKVSSAQNHYFTSDETYQILDDSNDIYLSLLLIGKTIYNYFPLYFEGGFKYE